jgi:hypothetical protein
MAEWTPPSDAEVEQSFVPPSDVAQPNVTDSNRFMAFGKSALENIPAALGAVATGVPAFMGGAAQFAPAGPVGSALGGLVYGTLGAAGGAQAVDKVSKGLLNSFLSKQAQEDLGYGEDQRAAERAQFPVASKLGELAPDVATMAVPTGVFGRGVLKIASNNLWAKASPTQKEAWKTADDWGLSLHPTQVQESKNARIMGKEKNTRIMINKAAEATGDTSSVQYLNQKYLDNRFDTLGKEYDRVYSDPSLGQFVPLEQNAQDSITTLFANQIPMPTQLKNRLVQGLQSVQQSGAMDGKDFKFIVSELKKIQRTSSDGNVKYAIGDTIDNINQSLANTNPQLKAALDELNPKYRAVKTLQDARNKDIIDVDGNLDAYQLGRMIKDDTRNPLYQIGHVGESLGVGSHVKGDVLKNNLDAKGPYLYGITPKVNIANKLLNFGKAQGTGMGAKYLTDINPLQQANRLVGATRQSAPALGGIGYNELMKQ